MLHKIYFSWQNTLNEAPFVFLSALFTDWFFTKVLVLAVARWVSRFTLVDTLRCVSMLPSAGGSGAIYVVLTGFDGVGTAACRRRYRLRGVNTYGATLCLTLGTHQYASDRGLRRPDPLWSRSPRHLKGSHRYIWTVGGKILPNFKEKPWRLACMTHTSQLMPACHYTHGRRINAFYCRQIVNSFSITHTTRYVLLVRAETWSMHNRSLR